MKLFQFVHSPVNWLLGCFLVWTIFYVHKSLSDHYDRTTGMNLKARATHWWSVCSHNQLSWSLLPHQPTSWILSLTGLPNWLWLEGWLANLPQSHLLASQLPEVPPPSQLAPDRPRPLARPRDPTNAQICVLGL